jgi:type II secretory pathway component PulF
MPQFAYRALDKLGKTVAGNLEADSQPAALKLLRKRGLYPEAVKQRKLGKRGRGSQELATLILLLGRMLRGGLPLDRALELLAEEIRAPRLRQALTQVLEAVKSGSDLAGAMAESSAFPALVVEMVRAGESSGQLALVLDQLAAHLAAAQESKQAVTSALLYPALLLLAALSSTAFLFVFLLPRLSELFADFGQELPASTALLMALGSWLRGNWLWFLAVSCLLLWTIGKWLSLPQGRAWLDEFSLRLPAVGPLLIYTYTARLANTFAILLAGGVPLIQAFPIVRAAVGNGAFARMLTDAERKVKEGQRLAAALEGNQYLPALAGAMIAAGEETGSLGEMLAHLASTYQYRAELSRKTLLSLLEPAIILVMGLLVGFVVISVLLPIFDLNSYLN